MLTQFRQFISIYFLFFTLCSSNQLLDHLYEQNKVYFEDVSLYIAAAQRKKQEINANELPKLQNILYFVHKDDRVTECL
jgi:uncharacterized protein YaaN involved in tellurite resistance